MTFEKYIELSKEYWDDKGEEYNILALVSDTAKLLEKVKYYKNDSALLTADIGDVFFRLFATLGSFGMELDVHPFDLNEMKTQVGNLSDRYQITEDNLIQNYVFEIGVLANIVTENIKYGVTEIDGLDRERIKNSLYSYILQLLILVSRHKLSIDKILELNLDRNKVHKKELKMRF